MVRSSSKAPSSSKARKSSRHSRKRKLRQLTLLELCQQHKQRNVQAPKIIDLTQASDMASRTHAPSIVFIPSAASRTVVAQFLHVPFATLDPNDKPLADETIASYLHRMIKSDRMDQLCDESSGDEVGSGDTVGSNDTWSTEDEEQINDGFVRDDSSEPTVHETEVNPLDRASGHQQLCPHCRKPLPGSPTESTTSCTTSDAVSTPSSSSLASDVWALLSKDEDTTAKEDSPEV